MHPWRRVTFAIAATVLSATAARAADLTAAQRAAEFGISDIRGVAYIPGPQGPAKPIDPGLYSATCKNGLPYFTGTLQTYTCTGARYQKLAATYTIYYDSDFYNADFQPLWGTSNPSGRDDLRRFKSELNANFMHLYDWQPDSSLRNHHPFLNYAHSLGMRVTIPISNYILQTMCNNQQNPNWQELVSWVFQDIYDQPQPGKIDPAAGVLSIFNEYDLNPCPNKTPAAPYVAQVALYWKQLEDAKGVPDNQRLPIIFPVSFTTTYNLPGGAVLDAFKAIMATFPPGQGLTFWNERVLYATNPFNSGSFMSTWLTTTLPAWFKKNGIPTSTPVMFTEYGYSSANDADQASWVSEQFQAVYLPKKPANFLGACAFVNEYRFWLEAPQPNYALMNFNQGPGTWNEPATMYVHTQQYQNPNAQLGVLWTANYQIDPQKPRPAYCEIGKVFYGSKTPPPCP